MFPRGSCPKLSVCESCSCALESDWETSSEECEWNDDDGGGSDGGGDDDGDDDDRQRAKERGPRAERIQSGRAHLQSLLVCCSHVDEFVLSHSLYETLPITL